ncbi:hypothetical protein [Stomatohabitans albus]|uniref:hypothetical protein n=1 Tax=Stomatohabitans albus TaxID=3110766 RepID=UPI00300C1D4A
MGKQFQTSAELGVALPPGTIVPDDDSALSGIASVTRGNPTQNEIAIISAVLLGLRTVMAEDRLEHDDVTAWSVASKAERLYQSPFISAADPRLNARSNRSWFSRR